MSDRLAAGFWSPLVVLVGAALASVTIVATVRWVGRARAWLDVPNERSSHRRPTPTAGGIGIVVPFLLALALLPQALPARVIGVCVAAIAAVAAIGLVDDLVGLGAAPRLAVHVVGGLAIAGSAGTAVTDASINVVNFMDGIDGLIGTTALVFGLFCAVAIGPGDPLAGSALMLAGASLGFLLFNRPPGSIFMGDVGSGALGAAFIVFGLLTIAARGWSIFHAFLPLAPLVLDEVLTMARRLARGENIFRAHRSHVYQVLVASGWSHGRVTAMYGAASALLGVAALSAPNRTPAAFLLGGGLIAGVAVGLVVLRRRALALAPRPRP